MSTDVMNLTDKTDSGHNEKYWSRAILLVDMNAFFASVEQRDHPEWRGRALVVTNGRQGTCIITASYEARSYGIKTGMRLQEARRLCRHLIQVPARPARYVAVSRTIMDALATLSPDIEVFSVDEAFLDVTRCQLLLGSPAEIGRRAKALVHEASGLLCSVGVSGDRTTAKYAAKLQKPDGLVIIPPWEAKERLRYVAVTELSGIKSGIGGFLQQHGAVLCGEVEKIPVSVLIKRFGYPGRRIWLMCQGADPEPVVSMVASPKSMGHGKVMPPRTTSETVINTWLLHMCEKLGARLRRSGFRAQHFFAGLLNRESGWLGAKGKYMALTDSTQEIYEFTKFLLQSRWQGEPVCQIQVTALDPQDVGMQLDFFRKPDTGRQRLYRAVDAINNRYGEMTIMPAPLLDRSAMPDVISPAWKPEGHRQTI